MIRPLATPLIIALAAWCGAGAVAAGAVSAQQESGVEAASASPEQLDLLREILARPEFREAGGREGWIAFLEPLRWLLAVGFLGLLRLLSGVFRSTGDAPLNLIVVAALLTAAGAGVIFLRLVRGTVAAEAAVAQARTRATPTADGELEQARFAARDGQWRRAVHHRYLAVLRRLDERGVLPFDGSLTNVEYLRRVAGSPTLLESLSPLVSTFDRLWYSQAECQASDYDAFSRLAERAWQASR